MSDFLDIGKNVNSCEQRFPHTESPPTILHPSLCSTKFDMEGANNGEEYFEQTSTDFELFREERQREVDRLSLELLSNTKHYKKYIAKNHPEEQIKLADNTRRFLKYKSKIAAILIELLDEYETPGETSMCVGSELQTLFEKCVQKTIQHLEWTEYKHSSDNGNEFEEEDVMFAIPRNKRNISEYPYSYWGATIRKQGMSDDF